MSKESLLLRYRFKMQGKRLRYMFPIRVVTRARARVLPSREMDQTALRLHLLKITVMR